MEAVENMAMDAGMLEWSGRNEASCMRVYGWMGPSITFGYSQRWEEMKTEIAAFPCIAVRRMTGGGIVDHRQDLTYSISVPAAHPWHRSRAPDLYRKLHQLIREILDRAGFDAGLAPCRRTCHSSPSGIALSCFTGPETDDLMNPRTGRKIGGAAMKRTQMGLLVQGSLSRTELPGLEALSFEKDFGEHLAMAMGCKLLRADLGVLKIRTEDKVRFASTEWNQRR